MPGGLHPPLSVIESWPKPNYDHPWTTAEKTSKSVGIVGGIALIIVVLRMWARFVKQRNAGIDDYLMLIAILPTYGCAIACTLATDKYGYNRHIWDTRPEMIVEQRKIVPAIQILYIIGVTFIKLSVLTFDRRLGVRNVTPRFIWAVRLSITLVSLYGVIWTILVFTQCVPFEAYWEQFAPDWAATHNFHCLDEGANIMSNTVVSTITDFVAFMLPLSLLWRLQMSRRQKVLVSAVFAVGLLVCIVGCVRIGYIAQLYYTSYDSTYEAYKVFGSTAIEPLLAIACASAPALKIYFAGLRDRFGGGTTSSKNKSKTTSTPKSKMKQGPVDDVEMNAQLQNLDKSGAATKSEDLYEMKRQSSNSEEYERDGSDGLSHNGSYYPLTGNRVNQKALG